MASITINIQDATAAGKIIQQIPVSFSSELNTVKDIITARVTAEVSSYNNKKPEYYTGLVQPSDAEKTLNGFRLIKKKNVNAKQQCEVALDAFSKNGYFVLVDNIQAESLEQMVVINENTLISFVKLTPLIGG